jgi:ABC-2 type transport system ATP-binding protein
MSAEPALQFADVAFAHDRALVLDGFDLEVQEGEVVLLAAPNGRGKTTALWLAAGVLSPARGSVRVLGRDPYRERVVLARVGFVPEGAPLPERWTGRRVLDFQRATFPRWDDSTCRRLVETFEVDLGKEVRELSRGQRGRLAIIAVLCTRPELLLLDEPTLGLDVATRRKVTAEILGRVAHEGVPILIAGHDVAEAELSADRIVIMDHGRVLHDERVGELLDGHRILAWDTSVPEPSPQLDLIELHAVTGRRALAQRVLDEPLAQWQRHGGRVEPADLETIYLARTGELDHA